MSDPGPDEIRIYEVALLVIALGAAACIVTAILDVMLATVDL